MGRLLFFVARWAIALVKIQIKNSRSRENIFTLVNCPDYFLAQITRLAKIKAAPIGLIAAAIRVAIVTTVPSVVIPAIFIRWFMLLSLIITTSPF